jgi:hypothetical protein
MGASCRVRAIKSVDMLMRLVNTPNGEVHVLELR